MKHLIKKFIVVVLILLLQSPMSSIDGFRQKPYPHFFSYISTSPIIILNDQNFTDYAFPGNGTANSPFIIENLNITTNEETAILVSGTSQHFVIRNCLISAERVGIFVNSTDFGTVKIENNICKEHSIWGILVEESPECLIINNTCTENGYYGIHTRYSPLSEIRDNNCYLNWDAGIYVDKGNYTSISSNTCSNNPRGGIVIEDSLFTLTTNNYCSGNDYNGGISLSRSEGAIVNNNTCIDNILSNIRVGGSKNSRILNNICSGLGEGITIVDGRNVTIQDNNLSTYGEGMNIIRTENSQIQRNQLQGCGLRFYDPNKDNFHTHIVTDNTVNSKVLGYFVNKKDLKINEAIYGQLILADCNDIEIKNQQLSNTYTGITMHFCLEGVITNNWIFNTSYIGVNLLGSSKINLLKNSLDTNNAGIVLENSSLNELHYNNLDNNKLWGVVLDIDSDLNYIHHNSFIANNYYYGTSQAKDDGQNNTWSDIEAEKGNYWSDYQGTGNYSIDGLANVYDLYPLTEAPIYVQPSYYGYFAFLSLLVLIPIAVFLFRKYKKNKK